MVRLLVGALFLLASAVVVNAAPPAGPPTITTQQARAAADEVIRLIEAHYVFPDKRAAIAGALKASRDAGKYDVTDPMQLGALVTADLLMAANDRHLGLSFNPERYEALTKPKADGQSSPWASESQRRHNYGYEEQRVLPGNVRYISVNGFMWDKKDAPASVDAAARFLSGGDAIIVDLRRNGGGDSDAVQRLISYFMPTAGQELMKFHDGLTGKTDVTRVMGSLPAPRLTGKPLYVLIGNGVASAAEEFAYHVQQFKLGTLVGRKTAGAANNNSHYPVAPFFVASISVGRPEHPVSHTNWEQVGISPDVEAAPDAALERALLLALKKLGESGPEAYRADYAWDAQALEAKANPVTLSEQELDAYAGTYGVRKVFRQGKSLYWQREGRDPVMLVPLGRDQFGFTDQADVRVQFKRDNGRVVGFDHVTAKGVIGSSPRTGD